MSDKFSQSAAERLLPKEAGWRDPDAHKYVRTYGPVLYVGMPIRPTPIPEKMLAEIIKRIRP